MHKIIVYISAFVANTLWYKALKHSHTYKWADNSYVKYTPNLKEECNFRLFECELNQGYLKEDWSKKRIFDEKLS